MMRAFTLDLQRNPNRWTHEHICPECGEYACRQRPCQAGWMAFCAGHVPSNPTANRSGTITSVGAEPTGRRGPQAGRAARLPDHLRATEPWHKAVLGGLVLVIAWLSWVVALWMVTP